MSDAGVVAEVKHFVYHWSTPDEPVPGATHFGVTAQVLIGPEGNDLADSFDCILCSPSMFADRFDVTQWDSGCAEDVLPGGEVMPIHGVWLMRSWSPSAFEAAVHRLATACSPGPDWGTVADRIGRHLPWEYDYRHDNRTNERAGLPRPSGSFWHDDADVENIAE